MTTVPSTPATLGPGPGGERITACLWSARRSGCRPCGPIPRAVHTALEAEFGPPEEAGGMHALALTLRTPEGTRRAEIGAIISGRICFPNLRLFSSPVDPYTGSWQKIPAVFQIREKGILQWPPRRTLDRFDREILRLISATRRFAPWPRSRQRGRSDPDAVLETDPPDGAGRHHPAPRRDPGSEKVGLPVSCSSRSRPPTIPATGSRASPR